MYLNRLFKQVGSLTRQYILYAGAIAMIVLLMITWVSYMTITTYVEEHELLLEKEAQKLRFILDEKILLIENIMQFIGTKIKDNSDGSDENIAQLIKHHKNNFKDEVFVWNIFYYINPEGYVIADAYNGLLERKIKLDINKRSWLRDAKSEHWFVKFSRPDVGLITGDYVLPMGIGINDRPSKKFLGYLGGGISIEKLNSYLVSFVGDDTAFLIYNDQKDLIISSEPNIEQEDFNRLDKAIILDVKQKDILKLKDPIIINGYKFEYYSHLDRFPISILIGKNQKKYAAELRSEMMPKIVSYAFLGGGFVILLLTLGYKVVRPIMELGRIADDISKGKKTDVPDYTAWEFQALSNQLKDISEVHRSLRAKQARLTVMNNEIANANEFIKSNMSFLSHELMNPTSSIYEFSKLLRDAIKTNNKKEIKEFGEILEKAADHQYRQLKIFLDLFKFQAAKRSIDEKIISLSEIISWNVSMVNHHIRKKNIKVNLKVEDSLKILGDEILLGQLIQNIVSNAAKYNVDKGIITISAFKDRQNCINIICEDTGVGINKRDLKNIFKIFSRAKSISSKVVGYGVGLAFAKDCVEAHNGRIEVQSSVGSGTKFIIKFPKSRSA